MGIVWDTADIRRPGGLGKDPVRAGQRAEALAAIDRDNAATSASSTTNSANSSETRSPDGLPGQIWPTTLRPSRSWGDAAW